MFPNLNPSVFQHDWDVRALDILKRARGFDALMSKVMEYGWERYFSVQNIASNIEISERQCPELYLMLKDAASALAVPVPKLYINMDPLPNAFTYGHKAPFIIIHHSLVDLLESDELFFVIAHEVGHIKCEHVLYIMVARNIQTIMQIIGQATLGIGALIGQGLVLLFLDWLRKAELSADRAGLLVTQDLDVGLRVLMKLAGGASPKLLSRLDCDAFLAQAEQYYELDKDTLSGLYKLLQTAYLSHPWPVLRAAELKRWYDSGDYGRIVSTYGVCSSEHRTCQSCGHIVGLTATFCESCGAKLEAPKRETAIAESGRLAGRSVVVSPLRPAPQDVCKSCGAAVKAGYRFCQSCGVSLDAAAGSTQGVGRTGSPEAGAADKSGGTPRVIAFEDPALEASVRNTLGKSSGDILPEDVAQIKELVAPNRGIRSLRGIEHFTSLRELYVHYNEISDLRPLARLTNLVTLSLSNNQVSDITPLLGLTNLREVRLGGNPGLDTALGPPGRQVIYELMDRGCRVST